MYFLFEGRKKTANKYIMCFTLLTLEFNLLFQQYALIQIESSTNVMVGSPPASANAAPLASEEQLSPTRAVGSPSRPSQPPPAPPPGPPPRSGKQSPEPCNYNEENGNNENDTAPYVLLGGDRQPSGQRRADHFDLRSERLSRSGLNQQNEGEWNNSKNMEKSETTMMLTSSLWRNYFLV